MKKESESIGKVRLSILHQLVRQMGETILLQHRYDLIKEKHPEYKNDFLENVRLGPKLSISAVSEVRRLISRKNLSITEPNQVFNRLNTIINCKQSSM